MSSPGKHRPRVIVRGAGFLWGFVLALPLGAALIVFVAQNTEQVTVRWTVWEVSTPLAVAVLVTIFAAVMLAETIGIVWRGRRRRILARQESLRTELAERVAPAETPELPEGEPAVTPTPDAHEETDPAQPA